MATWDEVQGRLDRDAVPALARAHWNAEPGSVRLASEGVNTVFRFQANGRGAFLRLTHRELVSHAELDSALDYLRHLVENDAPVCHPLQSTTGVWVEAPAELHGRFFATAVAEVPGEPIGLLHTEPAVYRAWGRSLARLHLAAERYRPGLRVRFESVDSVRRDTDRRIAPHDRAARAEFQRVDAWLRALPRGADVFGVTHFDYRPGNVFWDGETAWAIDFDDPVHHWYAADVARPFQEFAEEKVPGRRDFLAWFAEGYRSLRRLDDRWIRDVPWFMRLKDLGRYTWVLHCWSGPTVPGGEDRGAFLARMRAQFANPQPW